MSTRWALAPTMLCALASCTPSTVTPPSATGPTDVPAARLESTWTRRTVPAEGITVHATLWDASLVSAAARDDRSANARTRWTDRYLAQTAFTVVIELEDRQPVIDLGPLLDSEGWSFALSLNKGDDASHTDVLLPSDVDLLMVDRFPTASGSHHHRVTLAVFFPGTLHDAAKRSETLALRVRPKPQAPSHGRSMLGARWVQRGTTLRWHVTTRSTLPEH